LADGVGEGFQRLGRAAGHRADRGRRNLDAVKVVQELDDPVLRQQLHRRQIGDHGREVRPVLDRPSHRLGECRPRRRPAVRAAAVVGAVLGHLQRLWIGQVEDLAGLMADRVRQAKGAATAGAGRRQVVEDGLGMFGLPQRAAGVPLLAAGLAARRLAQAGRARRLPQPIAGRRLAAVGAVQSKLPLQFRHTRQQLGDDLVPRRKLRSQTNNLLLR
jgi:hypothetical protein